jgi:type I restriction enzyme, S subunit
MSLPRYPKYKDSGVEWLGEVPEHWVVSKLGYESWVRARLGWKGLKAEEYVDDGFTFLSTPNIKGAVIDFENVNFITEDRYLESPEIALREGDVLLAKDGSTLGTVNVVRSLPRPATVNSSIAVITPHPSMAGAYLHYLFQSSFMKDTIQQIKGGMGVPHLFQEDLNKFWIPLPRVSEQLEVATFLDSEIGKIDVLVDEQQQLIELLEEKRQAVICHAITKGLNPDAPMKDSGIEWLGEVPKHWKVKRLKQLIRPGSSISYGIVQPGEPLEEGVPFVQTTNISSGDFELDSLQRTTPEIARAYPRSQLQGGEVILGIRASIGAAFVVPQHLCGANLSRGIARIDCDSSISPKYLVWALRSNSTLHYWQLCKQGSTFNEVSIETVREIALALPSVAEQSAIVSRLNGVTAGFDELISGALHAIDLLQERRTALISAAVTGKIDVRGLATEDAA